MNTDKTKSTKAPIAAGSVLEQNEPPEAEIDAAGPADINDAKSAVTDDPQPAGIEETEPAEIDETEPAEIDDAEPVEIDAAAEPDVPLEKLISKGRRLSVDRVRGILQSLLFVADKPLTLNEVHDCTGLDRPRIQAALESLAAHYREGVSGIVLYEVGGGWQLRTDPSNAEYVRRFLRVKPQRLTRAAVETLAIIAYRQPVTRPEIEDIRGVDSGAVVKALLDRKLIKILGRKEEVGRPILYGTTREFLEFFALKDLASLPTLREFQELTQEHRDLVEKEAPAASEAEGPGLSAVDATTQAAVEALGAESDAALADLDQAIAAAEKRANAAASFLGAAQPPSEEPENPSNPS